MTRHTLLDFFDEFTQSHAPFLVYDDGYRTRTYRFNEVGWAARAFATRLQTAGIAKGDTVLLWSENRAEWIVAFWGCLLQGTIVVPLDYRSSPDLLHRIQHIVGAKLLVAGDDVPWRPEAERLEVWLLSDLEWAPHEPALQVGSAVRPAIDRDDIAEIIFTSGTTADPKGVTITHRNILANIVPIEREVAKYRKYARPVAPIRFLNLLPLSHMFGQAMATFIPPMLPGTVVFMRRLNAAEIVGQIRRRRVSVLVCVPKMLDLLRSHTVRLHPEAIGAAGAPRRHWLLRWWSFRRIHRLFGWRFWCFVVGGAPLEPDLEEFWSRLGFLVVQGYGLTETAPIVTLHHPLRTRQGSVGTPVPGVEVRIAPDGEILVRGENVTRGYYRAAEETAAAFSEGWLHTGDIGSFDESGNLRIRGRKKEMIVTPEGLNVFPEDVERVLNTIQGVRDSAVVGIRTDGQERVHAVLVLDPGTDAETILRQANARLESHQRIRSASVWPGVELPRTEGTGKVKRRELRDWIAGESRPRSKVATAGRSVEAVIRRFARIEGPLSPDTTLDELGLSSLERLELLMELEETFQTTIDETEFTAARTLGDLQRLAEQGVDLPPVPVATPIAEPLEFPAWNRAGLARLARRASLPTWVLPAARVFARIRVEGLDYLSAVQGPVVFAANHQSHLDTPIILAALPSRWRYRVAPAMAKEFFSAHFHPDRHSRREWLTNSVNYHLACLFFNAFPLPQRESGTRESLRYIGELVSDGWSILIYPEGVRTEAGEINRFRPGVTMIASRLRIPVVPVRLEGVDQVLHQSWKLPRIGRVRVAFGRALEVRGSDYAREAERIERAVRAL